MRDASFSMAFRSIGAFVRERTWAMITGVETRWFPSTAMLFSTMGRSLFFRCFAKKAWKVISSTE